MLDEDFTDYQTVSDDWRAKLEQYIKDGYIRVQKHPTKPLFIYNYTQQTQMERKWDEITRVCRGLVLDDRNHIIIQCPPKFFNLGEPEAADVSFNNSVISEKLDGYYISFKIDFNYGIVITSRGSFDNQYTRAVQDFLNKDVVEKLKLNYSYFCELCQNFPGDEGIIVAKHPIPRLVCWGIKTPQNIEILPNKDDCPLEIARTFTPAQSKSYLKEEHEGVVLLNTTTMERVKVKTEWYLQMHRIISDCTPKRVWELLSEGKRVQGLDIPDEMMPQMLKWQQIFIKKYASILRKLEKYQTRTSNWTDKELGLSQEIPPFYKTLLFSGRKSKQNVQQELIWKHLKSATKEM